MNLPATLHIMTGMLRYGVRCASRLVLAVLVAGTGMGSAVSVFAADSGGTVTHNPKQTVEPGKDPKSAELSLDKASAKLNQDGSQVTLTVNISSDDEENTLLDEDHPAKLEIETSDGKKVDPQPKITKLGETSDLSFSHEDYPGCKFKVTLIGDLWGSDSKGEPQDVKLDDCEGGGGGGDNNSVMFRYGLGWVRHGADGGVLKFESNKPSATMYSPKSLLINLSSQYVTRDANGVFQKAITDDTVTTITNVVENQGYAIEFAHRNGGVTGPTFKTVTISNPGATVIANTQDQRLFQEERWGASSFKYEIPLQDDSYKVQLYFAELYHDHVGGGVFNVTAEGTTVLSNYDVFQAAGGRNAARVEEVPAIVRDGALSLGFGSVTFGAHVSAIKVVRGDAVPIAGTTDDALYQSERTGNFSWHADLPAGNYHVTLLFAETTYNSVGRRTFNVTAQGTTVLSNYDIYAHTGLNTAGAETFPVTVTGSGLDLQIASVNGQAKVCAILVKDATTGAVAAAVNAGGEAFTAADGTVFAADSGFTGGIKNYPGRVVAAINAGSSNDYTAQDGTVFKADTEFSGGKVYAGVFNRFRLTEQEGISSPRISDFSWVADPRSGEFTECLLSKAGGLQVEGKQEVWSQDRQSYDEIRTIQDSVGHVLSRTVTTYEFKRFGVAKVREVEDPNGAAISTTRTYEEGTGIPGDPLPPGYGREKQMTRSNGYWEQYGYDGNGQRNKTVSQYLDSSLGDVANSRVETVTYSTSNPTETRIVKIQGKEVSRSHVAIFTSSTGNERWEITCATPGAAWNASGNLVSKTCRYPSDYSVDWLRGRLKWASAPDGALTTYSYTQSGANLVTIRDQGAGSGGSVTAGTRTVTTTNASVNEIAETVSDIATGLVVSSWTATEVDNLGRVTKKSYGDGSTESTVYVGSAPGCTACSGNHDLVDSETSREGITTSYKYDALGRRTETTRLGITEKSTLDANGRETKRERIGTDGSTTILSESHYDSAGRLDWTKDALGNQTNIAYSTDGLTTTTAYPYGTRVEKSYKDGKTKEISGSAVSPVKYAYSSWSGTGTGGEWTKEIKVGESGAETEWVKTYNDLVGRSVKTEYPDGAVATQSYNGLGQLVKSVDPDGVATLFAYNSKGEQETTALDLNGNGAIDFGGTDRITRTVRDVTSHGGTVVSRTTTSQWMQNNVDSPTVVAVSEQDGYGNKSWQTDANGNTTVMERTLLGAGDWKETATNPDNSQSVNAYQNGRLASTTLKSSAGAQLQAGSFHYDAHGRMDAQTDARNGTTNFTFDNADRMRTKTEPSANGTVARQVTQYDYNARGQLTKTTLPDTTETQNEYWPNGALKKTYGSQTYAVDYTCDPQGRMRTMTTTGQAGAAVTTWNYDPARGWLKTKVYADGKGPEYTYTPAGRLKTRKWARGIVTTYNYTAGDLTGIDYSDPTPDVTYVYNRRGLRDTVTDASGTRNIAYNVAGEIATETYTAGLMNGLSVERTFDSLLRRDGLTLKNGSTILHGETLGYGEASRLDHIIAGTERVDYGYEPNSALVHTVTFKHNGTTVMTTTKDYDFVNRLTEIKSVTGSTTVSRYAYDYNALNQRSKATLADNGYWSYDYNTKGEVINGTRKDANGNAISGQNFGYDFDGIGNRLTTSIDGATESSYTANALNQYTAFNSNSLTYDDDGNLTNDGLRQFTYNGENRLLQVRDLNNTLIATYTYDDQGRRVRKVTTALAPQGAQDLIFLWDGWNTAAQLTYQLTNAYQLAQAYTWGLDIGGTLQGMGGVGGLILEKDVMAGAYFPSFDGGGNLVNLIRASAGTIEAAYAYDPFGKVTVSSGPYADKNSWMYSSKFTDIESGLLIFQLRHSDPHLGRWISRDPEQEVGGENLYAFVGNDPVNKFDALGLSPGDAYDTVDAAVKAALDEAANATAQTVSRGQSEYAKKRGGHTYPEYGQYYKTGITSAPDYTHYRVFGIEYASFVYEFSDSGGTKYSYSALIKGQIPHDPASLGEVDIGKWNDQMAGQNKSKVCCPKAAVHTHTVDVKYEDGRVDNGSEFSEGDKTWAKNNKLPLWLRDATGADRKYE